jgi:hypothetical protein
MSAPDITPIRSAFLMRSVLQPARIDARPFPMPCKIFFSDFHAMKISLRARKQPRNPARSIYAAFAHTASTLIALWRSRIVQREHSDQAAALRLIDIFL